MRYTYFIQAANGPVKIGVARNVHRRLAAIQISSPTDVRLLLLLKGGFPQEREFHKKFEQFSLRGEWFNPAPELLAFIENEKANGVDFESLRPGRPRQTHCKYGHLLTDENRTRGGACKECRQRIAKEAYERRVDGSVTSKDEKTHCVHGHELTQENRTLDGHCRICTNEKSREYQRRKTEQLRIEFPTDTLCANELHAFIPNADGTCKACSDDTKKRWLDQNRDIWNEARRLRRGSKTGKYATNCKHGHEFSGDNLYINPKTQQRVCRACMSRRGKESKQRKFAETQGDLNGVI